MKQHYKSIFRVSVLPSFQQQNFLGNRAWYYRLISFKLKKKNARTNNRVENHWWENKTSPLSNHNCEIINAPVQCSLHDLNEFSRKREGERRGRRLSGNVITTHVATRCEMPRGQNMAVKGRNYLGNRDNTHNERGPRYPRISSVITRPLITSCLSAPWAHARVLHSPLNAPA